MVRIEINLFSEERTHLDNLLLLDEERAHDAFANRPSGQNPTVRTRNALLVLGQGLASVVRGSLARNLSIALKNIITVSF